MGQERNRKSNFRLYVENGALIIFSFICIFIFSFSFSDSIFVERDSYSERLSFLARSSDNNKIYEKAKFVSDSYLEEYSFYLKCQKEAVYENYNNIPAFLTLSDNSGAFLKLNSQSSSLVLPQIDDYSLVTVANFSNSKKFECLNIDLYKQIENERHISSNSTDFIYIPDFLADQIIEKNINKIKTYDDLINVEPVITISCSSVSRKCRIANIFHVKGFNFLTENEINKTDDLNTGKILEDLLGNYLITTSSSFFMNSSVSYYMSVPSSEFSIKDISEKCFSSEQKGSLLINFSYIKNGKIVSDSETNDFAKLYYMNASAVDGTNWPVFCLSIVLGFFFYASLYLLTQKMEKTNQKYITFLAPISLELVLFQFFSSFFPENLVISSLCNVASGATLLILFFLVCFLLLIKKHENIKNKII